MGVRSFTNLVRKHLLMLHSAVIVFLLFIIIVLLLDVLAIVLFLRDALKPLNFLIMNCFQTAFWLAVLIMDFVSVGQGSSAVGIGFSIFVLYVTFFP